MINPAEMTPKDHVMEALHFHNAEADIDDHGVGHIFLKFPNMLEAARWAFNMGISDRVRYLAPEDNLKKHLSDPIQVIYDFS